MPFEKGHKKATGRPKGSFNTVTTETRKVLQEIIDDNIEQIKQDIKDIELPEKRVKLFLELLQFVAPKLKSVELEQTNITENQLVLSATEVEIIVKELNSKY